MRIGPNNPASPVAPVESAADVNSEAAQDATTEATPVAENQSQRKRRAPNVPLLIRVPSELADFIRDRAAEEHVSTGVIVMWMAKVYRAKNPGY